MSELYSNAVCLAPMVRAGTLPLRLLSLRYGADLVYGEEIVDKRISRATRMYNDVVDAVDFIDTSSNTVVFRTTKEERNNVVFQLGTADAAHALEAAEKVHNDVAAIDINMGCPKHFSIQGGMGAALLSKPDSACDIIKTLRRNLNIPVSCKIRLLDSPSATLDLVKRLEQAGACAIGVHMREKHERPTDSAHWDQLTPIVSSVSIPILANGDLYSREDMEQIRKQTGVSSFLVARGALYNASVFRPEGLLHYPQVSAEYLRIAAETDNVFQNTKYTVGRMIPSKPEYVDKKLRADGATSYPLVTMEDLSPTKSDEEMFKLWGLEQTYLDYQRQFASKRTQPEQEKEEEEEDRPLYCKMCQVQSLSQTDFDMHCKGKKHKRRVRMAAPLVGSNKSRKLNED